MIGPSRLANCSANGSAACPGPPASAITALFSSPTGARWRRIASVMLPGEAPLGSSGTTRRPQANSLLPLHGANAISAPADDANADVPRHAARSTAAVFPTGRCTNRNLAARTGRCAKRYAPFRMSADREIVHASGAPEAIGPYSHGSHPRSRVGRRPLVLLGPDPARPGDRRAGRATAGRAGAALPGEPAGGLRRGRDLAAAGRAPDRLHDRPGRPSARSTRCTGPSSPRSRRRGWPSAWRRCRRAPTSRSTRSWRCSLGPIAGSAPCRARVSSRQRVARSSRVERLQNLVLDRFLSPLGAGQSLQSALRELDTVAPAIERVA